MEEIRKFAKIEHRTAKGVQTELSMGKDMGHTWIYAQLDDASEEAKPAPKVTPLF